MNDRIGIIARWGSCVSHTLVAVLVATLVGTFTSYRYQAQIATLKATTATEKRFAAEDATQRLQAAQKRGDWLSESLLITEDLNDQLRTEVHRALNQKTTGRACLNEPTLRVLQSAPGITISGLPPTTYSTSSPAAAGEAVATDTDIAHWAADAGAAYSTCSARLDALIDWHLQTHTTITAIPKHTP